MGNAVLLLCLALGVCRGALSGEVELDSDEQGPREEGAHSGSSEGDDALQQEIGQTGKVSPRSAERILVEVLRRSGFQTDEEIREAIAILRPPPLKRKRGKLPRKEENFAARWRRKRGSDPQRGLEVAAGRGDAVLRLGPRQRNGTSGGFGRRGGSEFVLPPGALGPRGGGQRELALDAGDKREPGHTADNNGTGH